MRDAWTNEESVVAIYFRVAGLSTRYVTKLVNLKCNTGRTVPAVMDKLRRMLHEPPFYDESRSQSKLEQLGYFMYEMITDVVAIDKLTAFEAEEKMATNLDRLPIEIHREVINAYYDAWMAG